MPDDRDKQQLTHWLRFFMDGGIPSANAVTYAVTFVENRIEKDMVADITKEYLQEMGIKPLGDIISILRQAKKVLQPKPMEIPNLDLSPPEPSEETRHPRSDSESPPRLRAKREDRFQEKEDETRRDASPDTSSPAISPSPEGPEPPVDIIGESSSSKPQSNKPLRRLAVSKQTIGSSSTVKNLPVKLTPVCSASRHLMVGQASAGRTRVVVPIQSKQKEEVPVPKKRRVLPEHEGGYKIKMPEGTTTKTAKILAQGKLVSDKLCTRRTLPSARVFDRLGQATTRATQPLAETRASPDYSEGEEEREEEEREESCGSEDVDPSPDVEFRVTGLRNVKLKAEVESTVKPSPTPIRTDITVNPPLRTTSRLTTVNASPTLRSAPVGGRLTTVNAASPAPRAAPVGGVFNRLGSSNRHDDATEVDLYEEDEGDVTPYAEDERDVTPYAEDERDVTPYAGVLKNRERLSIPTNSPKIRTGLKRTLTNAEAQGNPASSRSSMTSRRSAGSIRDRLGDNTVSSSSDIKSASTNSSSASARLGVTRTSARLGTRAAESRISSTVFSRLGSNK